MCFLITGAGSDPAGVEKQAEGLVNAAASLLVFQPVLKGRPAQAFLKVLLQLQGASRPPLPPTAPPHHRAPCRANVTQCSTLSR